MVLARKKCRNLIIWVILAAFAQILIYTMLYGELESSPRKKLAIKLRIVKLHSAGVVNRIDDRIGENVQQISKRIDQNVNRTPAKIFISRKLEKFRTNIDKNVVTNVAIENKEMTLIKAHKTIKLSNDASEAVLWRIGPDDIHISIKTTKQYHTTRLEDIRKTWWSIAKRETFLFTDGDDPAVHNKFDGHLINTNCKSGHQRSALCCKMQYELNYFWERRKKRWFCHFDDDNYVNFPALIKLLQQYNHSKAVYLGKTSLPAKMQTWDKYKANEQVKFWFATGGAGFCLSQKLVSMMAPHFRDQAFVKSCERIGLPDDCTIGFISEHLLGVKLTKIRGFHSHLEWLDNIPEHELGEQISLSHGYFGNQYNRIIIQGPFSKEEDPSRFHSLHCKLFPQTQWCK